MCNLDALRVWGLGLSVGAGFQGLVEMVDGLAGGIFHCQQTVVSHPASVKGLGLWVFWKHQGLRVMMFAEVINKRSERENKSTGKNVNLIVNKNRYGLTEFQKKRETETS